MLFAFGAANIDKKIYIAFLFAIFVPDFIPFSDIAVKQVPYHRIEVTV